MEVKGLKEAISVLKELDRGYVTRAKIRAINRVAKTGGQRVSSQCCCFGGGRRQPTAGYSRQNGKTSRQSQAGQSGQAFCQHLCEL
ncbi:prophage minor tail protein Z [Salmonella sp. NCTC 11881]|nr:prophage minor tail protein Z [Salmonella sp. NCTC 11881]